MRPARSPRARSTHDLRKRDLAAGHRHRDLAGLDLGRALERGVELLLHVLGAQLRRHHNVVDHRSDAAQLAHIRFGLGALELLFDLSSG